MPMSEEENIGPCSGCHKQSLLMPLGLAGAWICADCCEVNPGEANARLMPLVSEKSVEILDSQIKGIENQIVALQGCMAGLKEFRDNIKVFFS